MRRENEDGFLYSIAICWIWSRNRRSVIHDRFCHLELVWVGIGYFRRRFLVFHHRGKTKMAFIIAIAIYDGGIDVVVPTFLLGLVVWYGVLFESGLADDDDILGI